MRDLIENLINIVDGVGVIPHGAWRDDSGQRLKDTPEWTAFYVAARAQAERLVSADTSQAASLSQEPMNGPLAGHGGPNRPDIGDCPVLELPDGYRCDGERVSALSGATCFQPPPKGRPDPMTHSVGDRGSHGFLPIMPHHDADTVERIHAFDAWDAEHRRRDRLAGFAILPKVTRSTIYLAWRHWPHLLCWQWIAAWHWSGHRRRFFEVWRSGPGVAGGFHLVIRLLWLGYFSYQRQASDRIAALGPRWADAPVIFPQSATGEG